MASHQCRFVPGTKVRTIAAAEAGFPVWFRIVAHYDDGVQERVKFYNVDAPWDIRDVPCPSFYGWEAFYAEIIPPSNAEESITQSALTRTSQAAGVGKE